MSEHALWTKVREGLVDAADLKIDLMRVENMVMAGPPDVNGCYKGVEFWIELKHVDKVPVREKTKVFGDCGLRPEQIVWLHRRVKHGGNAWVLCRAGKNIWLVHGRHAKVFNELDHLGLIDLCSWWHNGDGKVDWVGLLHVICE